jgi:hypothetical protein
MSYENSFPDKVNPIVTQNHEINLKREGIMNYPAIVVFYCLMGIYWQVQGIKRISQKVVTTYNSSHSSFFTIKPRDMNAAKFSASSSVGLESPNKQRVPE